MAQEAGLALVVDPDAALAAMRKFDHAIESAAGTVKSFAGNVKRDFELIGRAAGMVLAPLKALVAVTATVKASMLAIGMASATAAGQYEKYRQQLLTVVKSQEAANRAFEESIKFSVATPFSPEQIIKTRIALEGVGIKGAAAVKSVSEAAAAMERDILDVARAVKSMEAEPIRNLGIMMDELSKRGVAEEFRKNAEEFRNAQKILLEVFEERFGGGVERMALTFPGLVSTLKGAIVDLRATFGEGFLNQAKLFVDDIIRGIAAVKEDVRAAGVDFGKEMDRVRINLLAGLDVAVQIAKDIAGNMGDKGGVGGVILESLKAGAKILGTGILEAFKASLSLWKLIGTIIGEGVLQAVYQSNIPGSGMAREYAIGRNLQGLSPEELAKQAMGLGIPLRTKEATWAGVSAESAEAMAGVSPQYKWRDKTVAELIRDLSGAIEKLSPERQLQYAQLESLSAENVTKAFLTVQNDLQTGMEQFRDVTVASLSDMTTVDIPKAFEEAHQRITEQTRQQLETWGETLNPKTGVASLNINGEGFRFAEDIGPGGEEWLKRVTRQLQTEQASGAVVAGYAEEMGFQKNLLRETYQEQEKMILIRQADIEAQREQQRLGLDMVGLTRDQKDAIGQLVDEIQKMEQMRDIGDEIGSGFARGFQQITMHARTAKEAMDMLADAAMNVLDRVMEITIWEPLAQSISKSVTRKATGSAMGNVFGQGNIIPFAMGGVIPGLTYFPMSGGRVGMAGERDIEAIFPLKRHPSGELGVKATVSAGAPAVSINIENNSSGEVTAETTDVHFDGSKAVIGLMIRDKRNRGAYHRAMGGR